MDIVEEAKKWARQNREVIARDLTSLSLYTSDDTPVSVFMAGSPGAGKTESSKRLLENFHSKVLRIDTDEYREYFKELGYDGSNSNLFQGAASLITEKVHDYALKNSLSFVFDGTLSNYEKAVENIQRSLKKGREVQILYVYQEPHLAWTFTQKREEKEGRKILKETFVAQFIGSQETAQKVKDTFGEKVSLDIIIKDIDNTELEYIRNAQIIQNHIKKKYSLQDLNTIL
jgi:UDP-N-acetylglucosamine kinase